MKSIDLFPLKLEFQFSTNVFVIKYSITSEQMIVIVRLVSHHEEEEEGKNQIFKEFLKKFSQAKQNKNQFTPSITYD